MIYYQIVGRGLEKLNDFIGACVYDLKKVVKERSQLQFPPAIIKLWVVKPGGEKEDLDKVGKAFKKGKPLNFSRLLNEYEIDEENPISVELLGR